MAKRLRSAALVLASVAMAASGSATTTPTDSAAVIYAYQGPRWTQAERDSYYHRSQGSALMPWPWMQALKQPGGAAFLAGNLARYGFLPDGPGLPVGFSLTGPADNPSVGLTCSACHTRQITVSGALLRVDGGPAFIDIQSFFADIDVAVGAVANSASGSRFVDFATSVLGHKPAPDEAAKLEADLQAWYVPYNALMHQALPPAPWGLGRLDAFGMIFDRLTGLDIGTTPDRLITKNIQIADAPVRYPFLWNSPFQDHTQWPGMALNGNDIFALVRNLAQVYGVFATFKPEKMPTCVLGYDYLNQNTADMDGLKQLENDVKDIGPPRWPFAVNAALAQRGKHIYGLTANDGICAPCHGVASPVKPWTTRRVAAGTDTREYKTTGWMAETGILEGAKLFGLGAGLPATAPAASMLLLVTANTLVQSSLHMCHGNPPGVDIDAMAASAEAEAVRMQAASQASPARNVYEARVLDGIWAAAPYLHNGSVPTLADLLTPPEKRPASFAVGPEYDIARVGLAIRQPGSATILKTTGCDQLDSGNSRCGHDWGTTLSNDDKAALIEYLKTL